MQCGLCQSTCPEKVITLTPQIDFTAAAARARLIKEEEPALCITCSKPFGVKASIDRVVAQLAGRHWMFKDKTLTDRMRMCADCRVIAQSRQNLDPYAGPPRPPTRTTDDYRQPETPPSKPSPPGRGLGEGS